MDAKPKHSAEQLAPLNLYQNCMDELIDLNDSELLPHLQDHELHMTAMNSLGYALVYMNYLHPSESWTTTGQRSRVETLCDELRAAWEYRRTDFQYWRGFVYRIQDETENMC